MKNIVIFSCLFLSTQMVWAQAGMKDTVSINYEDKVHIFLIAQDDHDLKENTDIRTIFSTFQQTLRKVSDKIPDYNRYLIAFQPGKSLDVKKLEDDQVYELQSQQVTLLPRQQEFLLAGSNFQIKGFFIRMEDLMEQEIQQVINQAIDSLPRAVRFTRFTQFRYANQGFDAAAYQSDINAASLDLIELRMGVGASLIRNQFLTDISAEIGLKFFRKGRQQHDVYISDNLYYLFDSAPESSMELSNFVNFGYRWQMDETNQLGLEIGLPVYKEGNFFEDTILRIGFSWNLSKQITISPQLYINDGFKSAYPGIRVGFGL